MEQLTQALVSDFPRNEAAAVEVEMLETGVTIESAVTLNRFSEPTDIISLNQEKIDESALFPHFVFNPRERSVCCLLMGKLRLGATVGGKRLGEQENCGPSSL